MKDHIINWKDGTSTFWDEKTNKIVTKKTEELIDILNSFNEDADAYAECKRIVSELESIGWTAEWGLDGELYDLKQISLTNKTLIK